MKTQSVNFTYFIGFIVPQNQNNTQSNIYLSQLY